MYWAFSTLNNTITLPDDVLLENCRGQASAMSARELVDAVSVRTHAYLEKQESGLNAVLELQGIVAQCDAYFLKHTPMGSAQTLIAPAIYFGVKTELYVQELMLSLYEKQIEPWDVCNVNRVHGVCVKLIELGLVCQRSAFHGKQHWEFIHEWYVMMRLVENLGICSRQMLDRHTTPNEARRHGKTVMFYVREIRTRCYAASALMAYYNQRVPLPAWVTDCMKHKCEKYMHVMLGYMYTPVAADASDAATHVFGPFNPTSQQPVASVLAQAVRGEGAVCVERGVDSTRPKPVQVRTVQSIRLQSQ